MKLVPKKDFGKEFLQLYAKAQREVVVTSRRDPKRLLNLRCSQLPFCALSFFHDVCLAPTTQRLDMMGLYYTTVGTAVHTVMQTALMQSSQAIVGDWLCRDCGTVEHFTTQRDCCGFPMDYEELSIDYKGIQGHVDTLFLTSKIDPKKKLKVQLKNGKYWVVDYKTTSEKAKASKAKNPGASYMEQVITYAYLLQKQFGIIVEGAMLVFIPRDNPKDPVVWSKHLEPKDFKIIAGKLKRYKAAHKAVLSLTKRSEVKALIDDFGTCKSDFCTVCKSPNILDKLLQAHRVGKQYLPLRAYIESKSQ